jgi:hypothetical protein
MTEYKNATTPLLISNFLSSESDSSNYFDAISKEIPQWEVLSAKGIPAARLAYAQGTLVQAEGVEAVPMYRHPADVQLPVHPFTPTVLLIKEQVEKLLKCTFNSCLVQLYRDGKDSIGAHCDKTLDMKRGSAIAIVSLYASASSLMSSLSSLSSSDCKTASAMRTMVLEPKPYLNEVANNPAFGLNNSIVRIPLLHNSLLVLDSSINRTHTHAIYREVSSSGSANRRPTFQPRTAITATTTSATTSATTTITNAIITTTTATAPTTPTPGTTNTIATAVTNTGRDQPLPRLSLTFRQIETFLTKDGLLYGQGAKSKTIEEARRLGKRQLEDVVQQFALLYKAFAKENKVVEFNWDEQYGKGFDILDNQDQPAQKNE